MMQPQQEQAAVAPVAAEQPSIFKQSSHPVALFFHLAFRTAAVTYYLVTLFITTDFTLTFINIVLLLAFDFWTVKNVTGRLLVGLRWWNRIKEDGTNEWIYETKPPNIIVNPVDSRIFWSTMYIFPIIWTTFAVVSVIKFNFDWLILCVVAIVLNSANLTGYSNCDKEAKKRAMGNLGTGIMSNLLSNRITSFFS